MIGNASISGSADERQPAPEEAHHIFQDQQQAKRDQQLVFLGAAIERPQQQRLDDGADQRNHGRADGNAGGTASATGTPAATARPTSQAVTKAPTA